MSALLVAPDLAAIHKEGAGSPETATRTYQPPARRSSEEVRIVPGAPAYPSARLALRADGADSVGLPQLGAVPLR